MVQIEHSWVAGRLSRNKSNENLLRINSYSNLNQLRSERVYIIITVFYIIFVTVYTENDYNDVDVNIVNPEVFRDENQGRLRKCVSINRCVVLFQSV